MEKQFELLTITRKNILKEFDACSIDQIFAIPKNFNNNIIWNVIHVVATQNKLVYTASDTQSGLDEALLSNFVKGTVPTAEPSAELVDFVKAYFLESLAMAQRDYKNHAFGPYKSITTSYGATLNTIEEAITFLNLHESMHYGQIKMLKRLVTI